ncbi:MAG: Nramp family divalent metal transporter [Pirellulaceae bacterium]
MNNSPTATRWYHRVGPGLITACVVIGPGSIMTSSTVGANERYAMLWVVAVSVAFMLLFMSLGAKLGAVGDASPGELIRRHAGWPLAWMLGLSVFFISSAYQSGNNIGVAAAFEAFVQSKWLVTGLLLLFNALAIGFLYAFRDLYAMLERVMMVFVGLMLVSFAINLIILKPDVGAMAAGFIPSLGRSDDMLPLLGLNVGTTLVIAGAFYQAYLVRQKGWKIADLKHGMIDARVGAIIMFLITVMLMSTAAAGLYTGQPVKLADPVEVAESLEVTFGPTSKFIFVSACFPQPTLRS